MKRTPLRRHTPLRKSKRDAQWERARDAARERDGWRCQGNDRGLLHHCDGGVEVHHLIPRGRGGKHDLDNLVTLCSLAHRLVHGHPTRSYELGLLKRGAA